MMDKLIEKFPDQLKEGLEIGVAASINQHDKNINKVVVLGMGGSGIGGDFVSEFVKEECKVPVLVSKSYFAPAYVDENTLVIVSSYSGNTEETLNAYNQIKDRGAKIVCVTSGGKVLEFAKERGYDYIAVPANWPSPRACLGYSIVGQLFVLRKLGLIGDETIKNIGSAIDLVRFNMDEIQIIAKKIADRLYKKIPIIYTTDRMESVAVRFRQQLNENAKMLAWSGVIPEMNHNELVGWRSKDDRLAVIYFRTKSDYKRNGVRMDINKKIISNYCDTIIEVYAKGKNLVEEAMYLVHLGDWISYYLSESNQMDSIEVKVIDYLKAELAKV